MRRTLPHLIPLGLALLSTAAWICLHLLGWRQHVEVLSGNVLVPEQAVRGAAYAVAWLQWVILAPALTAGGLLGLSWEAWAAHTQKRRRSLAKESRTKVLRSAAE